MSRMRRKIWIHNFQTVLMIRIALYLLFFQVTTACVLYSLGRMSAILKVHASESIFDYVPLMAVLAAVFLTAAFLYDALKLTHRLVGPVLRLRKTMQAVTAGEEIPLVRLRQGDMFTEVADEMNQMLQKLAERGAISLHKGPAGVTANSATPARQPAAAG